MADFSALKAAIQAAIRQNGNNEITGNIMQGILLSMVNTMGDAAINALVDAVAALSARVADGYMYGGIATPTSTPTASSGKVFYIALQAGTYTRYGGQEVLQGITLLNTDGYNWTKEQLWYVDEVPTENSNGLVKSGGVYEEISQLSQEVIEIASNLNTVVFDDDSTYDSGILLTDGSVDTSFARYRVSPFIEIVPNSKIKYVNIFPYNGPWCGLCIYDSDKNKIGNITSGGLSPVSGTIDASSFPGAKYIRFTPFDSADQLGEDPVEVVVIQKGSDTVIWEKINQIDTSNQSQEEVIEKCENELFREATYNVKYGDHTSYSSVSISDKTALLAHDSGKLDKIWVKSTTNSNGIIRIYKNDRETITFEKQISVISGENTIDLSSDNVVVNKGDFIALEGVYLYFAQLPYQSVFYDYTNGKISAEPRTDRVAFSFETILIAREDVSVLNLIESSMGNISENTEIESYNTSNTGNFSTDTQKNVIFYYSPLAEDAVFTKARLAILADVGDVIKIHIGIIDQRGLWIEKEVKNAKVTSVESGVATITPIDIISVPSGYLLAFELNSNYWKLANSQVIASSYPDFYTIRTEDLNSQTALTPRSDYGYITYFQITWTGSVGFSTKEELAEIKEDVEELGRKVSASNVYIDKTTGQKYLLGVDNGQISLEPILFEKIYFAGNSFTEHESNSYWWGNGRGMAASTDDVQYTELLANLAHSTYGKHNYYQIELHINEASLDMTSYIPSLPANDYKLLVIQLGENASLTNRTNFVANWEAMIDRFHSLAPDATIVQVLGWSTGDKKNAIVEACEAKNVVVIDCVSAAATGNFRAGDYTMDSDGITQHPMPSNIITHPSDVGMALIANNIAQVVSIDNRVALYDLTIVNSTGGSISIAYNKWVAGGLVSVKTEPSVGYTLQSLNVNDGNQSIPVTTHIDGVCTFIMPTSDVTITPTWQTT